MGRFFKSDEFEFSTEIALGCSYYRLADPGEVLSTVGRIKDGDYESWCREWAATASRAREAAERSEAAGHRVGAREAWLRASSYYREVAFYALGTKEWKLEEMWRAHRGCFERAAALFDPPLERVAIPYEGRELEGWFFPVDDSALRRPLLLLNNGSDGTVTDMIGAGAAAGNERGYNCLTFDGPGQGQALFEQGLHFRPDWEHVITPVVDYALSRPDVDDERIALLGISQGGYWVPRAVAFEHRIAAAVADPGVVDVSRAMTQHLGRSLQRMLERGEREKFDRNMRLGERFSKSIRFTLKLRGLPYGAADSPYEMFRQALDYRLEPETIERIRCPVLITDPENEQFWPGQSQELYDALPGPKALVSFTAEEGADGHCEPLGPAVRAQRIFDWLDETLGRRPLRQPAR